MVGRQKARGIAPGPGSAGSARWNRMIQLAARCAIADLALSLPVTMRTQGDSAVGVLCVRIATGQDCATALRLRQVLGLEFR
jgi:hypothetical protein